MINATQVDWSKVQHDAEDGYVTRLDIAGRGIRCNVGMAHRHLNVDTVKACHLEAESMRAEAEAERYAEEGYVQYLENQGSCSGIVNYTDPQGGPCLCC